MPQLVNSFCSVCGQRISSVLDARFCEEHARPVHNACRNSGSPDTKSTICSVCGCDLTQAYVAECHVEKAGNGELDTPQAPPPSRDRGTDLRPSQTAGRVLIGVGAVLLLGNVTGLLPTLPFAGLVLMAFGGTLAWSRAHRFVRIPAERPGHAHRSSDDLKHDFQDFLDESWDLTGPEKKWKKISGESMEPGYTAMKVETLKEMLRKLIPTAAEDELKRIQEQLEELEQIDAGEIAAPLLPIAMVVDPNHPNYEPQVEAGAKLVEDILKKNGPMRSNELWKATGHLLGPIFSEACKRCQVVEERKHSKLPGQGFRWEDD